MEYVLIGKVLNTHGIKGDLKIECYSDFPLDRFKKDSFVYLGEDYLKLQVNDCRKFKEFYLLSFVDLLDINLVEKYKDLLIYKAVDDIKPLEEGKYFFKDIRDLDVIVGGNKIGKVLYMESGVKYNFMRIKVDKKEVLVPYLPQFVKKVDLNSKTIELFNVEGLL